MLWHVINYFRKKVLHGGMQTLTLIQNKTVPVCCLCLFYLAQIDHGEDVWLSFPVYDPLSLSGHVFILWTERRHLSPLPPRPKQRGTSSNCVFHKLFVLRFCTDDMNYFHVYLFQLHLEVISYTCCSSCQATSPLCTLKKYLDYSGYQSTVGLW